MGKRGKKRECGGALGKVQEGDLEQVTSFKLQRLPGAVHVCPCDRAAPM